MYAHKDLEYLSSQKRFRTVALYRGKAVYQIDIRNKFLIRLLLKPTWKWGKWTVAVLVLMKWNRLQWLASKFYTWNCMIPWVQRRKVTRVTYTCIQTDKCITSTYIHLVHLTLEFAITFVVTCMIHFIGLSMTTKWCNDVQFTLVKLQHRKLQPFSKFSIYGISDNAILTYRVKGKMVFGTTPAW